MAARNIGIGVLFSIALWAGCGRGGDEPVEQTTRDTVAGAPEEPPLSDNQALDVLTALSAAGADAAANVPETVASPEVRRYLNVVRADHEALQAELKVIADTLQLAPEPHPAAERLRAAAQDARLVLGQQAVGGADQAALQEEVKLNTLFLGALDSAVLRGPRQQLLTAYARAMRPTVSAHLQRAEQLQQWLRERPPVARPSGPRPPPIDTAPRPRPAAVDTGRRPLPDTVPLQ